MYIIFYIKRNTNIYISILVSILLFLDNFNLVYDLNNIKPVGNPEHITIIGHQAIELQKNKMIIYKLTKINEQPIIKHSNKLN